VTTISDLAFSGCIGLTNVAIGSGVTSIGSFSFSGCGNLQDIVVDPGNLSFSSLAGVLFDKSQSTVVRYPEGKFGDYTIPVGVTGIADGAFLNCIGLTNIVFPDGATSIGNSAFFNCGNLTNFILPAGITAIGNGAFYNCDNLKGIYFRGDAPTSIGVSVLDFFTTVYYLSGSHGWDDPYALWPNALWLPQLQIAGGFPGSQTNRFDFRVNWASGMSIVMEASTNLLNWESMQTNTLDSDTEYFSDPHSTNYIRRFYRVHSP
jgi:hypothetical protein